MMDCAQLAQFYEEYARGVLDGEERAEIEAHLARACPQCTPGIEKARWAVAQLATLAPDAQPPAPMRANILSAENATKVVTPIPKPSAPRATFPLWAWAAAAALALITGYSIRQMGIQTTQVAELRRQMQRAELQNRALQVQLELNREVALVMLSSDSKALVLTAKNTQFPVVRAYLHPLMGVAITADQMPPTPSGRTLQLWLVPKKGMPISVAIFRPDSQGLVTVIAPMRLPADEISALTISEEPAGGSPQPTSAPVWVGAL